MVNKTVKKKANIFKGESNPFNMKINHEKRCILGQKVSGTKGYHGISRGECYAKRKNLWQKTRVITGKANKFTDKRLMDGSEESSIKRLVQERKKKLKKNIFNLNEESLTHKGMPLDLMNSIPEGKESDSDEEPLDANFVNKLHFGGDSKSSEAKSHKEILDELIVESKKKKFEKKIEKEETNDLTEELDKGWGEFMSVVRGIKTTTPKPATARPDPYTLLTNQLKFEKRGTPTDRIKTAEELELEEKARLKKLEEERILRMNANIDQKGNKPDEHVSADSIFDDFDLEPILEQDNSEEKTKTQDDSYSSEEESDDSQGSAEEENETKIKSKSSKMNQAMVLDKNLPTMPSSLVEFEEYIKSRGFTSAKVYDAIENILKPYVKAKSGKNQKKLAEFLNILVEYVFKNMDENITISGEIVPHLHTIAEIAPLNTAEVFLKYLDEEQEKFQTIKTQTKKGFISLKSLIIVKYCSVLFSVSDYRHPVVTPALIYMCDILSSACPSTLTNITYRLFICEVLADCITQSKRFIPDTISFLNNTLKLALPGQHKPAPKKANSKIINLAIDDKPAGSHIADIDISNVKKTKVNDSIKFGIISETVALLHQFVSLYKLLPSYSEIFSETLSTCSLLPTDFYPDSLSQSVHNLVKAINETSSMLKQLVYQNTKPKPLKLFDPLFESKFDKREDIGKKFKLLKQVSRKIKREERCVVRDMRRDAQMIAAEKLKERLASDAERKRKVKELYHDLATQEGEYKKMMKKKS